MILYDNNMELICCAPICIRRKTPGLSGSKKILEVNLPESSRKFITCIRKYLLFYLKLLEEAGDICTLERAYISLRADKRVTDDSIFCPLVPL